MTGDGCLMEGVALEAISLAGHLQLDNLVLIYDNNAVTCDGPLDWINSEDTDLKMKASGWNVINVSEGSHDVSAIVDALAAAARTRGRPTFINIKTVIGFGTATAGTAKAHHGAFDEQSVSASKVRIGQDPSVTHVVPERALKYFRQRQVEGVRLSEQWSSLLKEYAARFPSKASEFSRRRRGELGDQHLTLLRDIDTSQFAGKATREINGSLLERLWPTTEALIGGGADLINSNKFWYSEHDVFHPSISFKGRYIRYGIREHAMASISNGLAAYGPGTFLPLTATFFMFYIYVSAASCG